MENPVVSIVIPSYKPTHFEQALRSAIGQTYNNIEILVSDNCPTDTIEEICRKFPAVNYSRNEHKGSLNVIDTLFLGSGEFVKPLFDDDLLHPFCVERMVEAMQFSKDIALTYSASAIIDQKNNITQKRVPFSTPNIIHKEKIIEIMALNFINFIGEFSSVMYRKNSISKFQKSDFFKFNKKDYSKGLADVIGFFNLMSTGHACYLTQELTYFRYDISHQSNSNPDYNKNLVYCVTDWVRILLDAHELNIVNDEKLISAHDKVVSYMDEWRSKYPITESYKQKYIAKISGLG